MTVLCVPDLEDQPWPTLGSQVCDFIEENLVHGPGDIRGEPARLDEEFRALIYRLYEVYPQGHEQTGRRRFKRGAIVLRKGTAKTELAAWITACEAHPDAPVRCYDWDGHGNPLGDGVADPYIPMVSTTEEVSEELAYGALLVILENSKIAGDFDLGLQRIMRRRGDGKVEAVAGSPNARDGARTTFQHYDETHRFVLPRLKRAHQTMERNVPKRKEADAWSLETSTAYSPGEGSVLEDTMDYARSIAAGKIKESSLFCFYRYASDKHDMATREGRTAAVIEATAPSKMSWSDLPSIVAQWDDPTANRQYLERTWTNRIVRDAGRAFDAECWKELARAAIVISPGELVTLGFDGSRREDSTAIVATHVATGHQWLVGVWEKPLGAEGDVWTVPEREVDAAITACFERWKVWRLYADPWGWGSELATWESRWGSGKDGKVFEFPTNSWHKMAAAIKNYADAILLGELTHDGHPVFADAIGNSCRRNLSLRDADGVQLWVIQKERPDSPMKIDPAMAGALSWEARTDAIAAGMNKPSAPLLPIGDSSTDTERRPEFSDVRRATF